MIPLSLVNNWKFQKKLHVFTFRLVDCPYCDSIFSCNTYRLSNILLVGTMLGDNSVQKVGRYEFLLSSVYY